MNIFRFAGDMSHILSFIILLHKIIKGKSTVGISLKTQELYAGAPRRDLVSRGARARAPLHAARGALGGLAAGARQRSPSRPPVAKLSCARMRRARLFTDRCRCRLCAARSCLL